MARLPRVVLPNVPHHVTQRGNRRQPVFFSADDYAEYMGLIAAFAQKTGTEILAYCLMPNHVHFVMVPNDADGLRATLGEAHRRYTRYVNFREGWRGHLWQERFHSFPMDEAHLLMAMRYIDLNPVRAGLVDKPAVWRWSSAAAHLHDRDDVLVAPRSAMALVDEWAGYLNSGSPEQEVADIEKHLRTGRPLGDQSFLARAEQMLERQLRKRRPGPKPKQQ